MPTRTSLAGRWKSVDRAHYTAIQLPPPILLKMDDTYFVYDGYHRVSVACFHGIECIEADVVNCVTRLPIPGDSRSNDLDIRSE